MTEFPEFKGIILGNDIVYEINGSVYACKVNKSCNPEEIANSASIYSCKSNTVYLEKHKRVNDKASRVGIYAYNLAEKKARICKIVHCNQ